MSVAISRMPGPEVEVPYYVREQISWDLKGHRDSDGCLTHDGIYITLPREIERGLRWTNCAAATLPDGVGIIELSFELGSGYETISLSEYHQVLAHLLEMLAPVNVPGQLATKWFNTGISNGQYMQYSITRKYKFTLQSGQLAFAKTAVDLFKSFSEALEIKNSEKDKLRFKTGKYEAEPLCFFENQWIDVVQYYQKQVGLSDRVYSVSHCIDNF